MRLLLWQGDELGLARYAREALLAPALLRLLDPLARARDEVPPDEALAVRLRAAEQHDARRGRGAHLDGAGGLDHREVLGRNARARDADLALDRVDTALLVLGVELEHAALAHLRRDVKGRGEHRHRGALAEGGSRDHAQLDAGRSSTRQRGLRVMVEGRIGELARTRQRDPSLNAVHARPGPAQLGSGALRMHDAAPRGHPVDVAGRNRLHRAQTVAVQDLAL